MIKLDPFLGSGVRKVGRGLVPPCPRKPFGRDEFLIPSWDGWRQPGWVALLLLTLAGALKGGDHIPAVTGTAVTGAVLKTSFGDLPIFPPDNPWNQDISSLPVHPNSSNYIASIGADTGLHPDFGTVWRGAPIGIPFIVVSGDQPRVPVKFMAYPSESDHGLYPIPPDYPIPLKGEGDRQVLVIDYHNHKLYELFRAFKVGEGWQADSGAIYDLASNDLRPAGWTSADAAGLPIFPGLVRYDEVVEQKEIRHALRFTAQRTQRAYISPARHFASASRDPNLPPMGLRVRLKAGYDISGFAPQVQVILRGLKRHGLILADNGGNWFITGAPDPRWDDRVLRQLKRVKGRDLEAVDSGALETDGAMEKSEK